MWRARGAMKNPAETLHGFLSAWLAFHILGEDQSMTRQIALVEAGESATTAFEVESQPEDNSTAALLKALHTLYHVLSRAEPRPGRGQRPPAARNRGQSELTAG